MPLQMNLSLNQIMIFVIIRNNNEIITGTHFIVL